MQGLKSFPARCAIALASGALYALAYPPLGWNWLVLPGIAGLFVCATSGVSQLIDPHGQIHARLPALVQGPLIGMIKRESRLTFYTRFGWITPWAVLGIAGVCWIALILPRRKSEIKPQQQQPAPHG